MDNTKLTSDFRNGMAHRFLITHADHQPTISYENGGMIYGAGRDDAIRSRELMAEINRSFALMAKFLKDVKLQINS